MKANDFFKEILPSEHAELSASIKKKAFTLDSLCQFAEQYANFIFEPKNVHVAWCSGTFKLREKDGKLYSFCSECGTIKY